MSFNFGSFGAGGASQPSGGFSQPSGRFSVFGGTSATPGQQQHATSPSTNIGEGTETSFGASTSALAQPTLRVPSYNELFPGRSIGYKIDSLLRASTFVDNDSQGAILAGQELIYLLNQSHHDNSTANRLLQHPNEFSVLEEVQPDHALRQRLAQCPLITLTIEQEDGSLEHREATLAPNMLQDVCTIADDLQISEVAAICLYQQAAAAETPFRSRFVQDLLIDGAVTAEPSSIAWMAREIYAAQSPLLLRTCLTLLQHRLREGDDNCTGNPVSEATDALLQSGWIDNFIRLVRDYTKCIKHVLSRSNTLASGRAHGSALLPAESRTHFWRHEVTLQICFKERQLAVECLFFVAYRVQMKVDEVVALIDLVRELMDGSVVLNPYTDVPDPFETFPAGSSGAISFMGNATSAAASPWFMQQQQQKEKDPLAWQQELATTAWKTGQPQLLRCASTLVMAVVSALGDRAVLMDRMTHAPNAFGRGNALLPPGSMSTEELVIIHSRLKKDAAREWKRSDVLGLMMAAYAMLLRSSPLELPSTRATRTFDVRKTWRECIEAPAELKSFTFARLCLIPCLRKPATLASDDYSIVAASSCDVAEFFLSLLSEYASCYLDILYTSGDRPISRAKWEQDADDDLRLRRAHQEEQRSFHGQFPAWSDTSAAADFGSEVPAEVDLLKRPDCMDDVIAFSTAVCSLGPDYAVLFWSQEVVVSDGVGSSREHVKLVPSRALRELEVQQDDDDSLRPSYLSFLAALALANSPSNGQVSSGAAFIHEMHSLEENSFGTQTRPGWSALFELLRWYIRQLNPHESFTAGRSAVPASSSGGSTAYYYFDQGSTGDEGGYSLKDRSSSAEVSSRDKPRELGDTNEFILLSHLALISNVAANSAVARCAIVAINLPVRSSDGSETIGQDSSLTVLYTLAVMPLSPEVRGAVFRAIATLLCVDDCSEAETTEMHKAALKGWELLEACQVIPINMLEQYPSIPDSSLQSTAGMVFPPSSTALALDRLSQNWIPADPRYSIMYEMEYVESSLGHYPSTEAFLQLLASLIAVGGFPSGLGQNWRARSGCAPYVEYVIDYILPRATGQFEQLPALPFRSTDDKSRLLARALEVVEIVLTRYVLPGTVSFPDLPAEKLTDLLFKSTQAAANHALGHVELGKITVVRPYTEDVKLMVDDFRSSPYQSLNEQADLHSTTQHISTAATSVVRSSIPRPKAPGFFVLAEMLSPVGYKLFSSVISPCVHQGINLSSKLSVDNFSMANALYIATPPTFLSAKEGALRAEPTNARKTLLKPLRPAPVPIDDVNFGERAILIALRILCATIAREDMFCQSVNAAKGQMSVVPVLRLQRKSLIPIAIDLQLSKLSRLLLSSEMVSSIINLIGFVSLNERIDADIASAATAIVFYIERSLARPQVAQLLSLADTHREGGRLAHAFNTRFLVASTRPLSQPDVQLLRFVFNRLLSELRTERSSGILTQVMFGFPKSNSDSSGLVRAEHADCLQSIVRLLGGNDFVFGASCGDVATSCYEILYRLTMIKSGDSEIRLALYTAERLRAIDFWKGHLIKIFSSMRAATHFATLANKYHVIHSISWLLKGAAGELHLLAGFSSGFVASAGFEGLAAPRPGQYKSLCQALFSDEGLVVHALRALPIERPQIDPMCSPPSDEQALIEAKEFLHGSPDIVQGYVTINFVTLVEWMRTKGLKVQEDGLRSWVDHWNHSVLRDCASAHLSDGIYYVLGSFVSSSNDAAFQIPTGIVAGTKMMIHILTCMTLKEDLNTSNQVLDGAFFTTACRNLALATRILASSVFSQGSDKTFPGESVETATVCSLMARAIACSAAGSQSPVSSRRNETTSILASALVPVLKALPDQRLRDEDHYFLFQAAMVLSVLSSDVDVKRIPAIQTPDTLVARACLSHLLETLENSSTEQGYCRALLTDTTKAGSTSALIQALIGLIPYLDENVATLLQMLVGLSHVADLLLAGGILEALQAAADKYQDEGARLLNSQAHNIHYGEAQIQTPAFLLGHFDLMGALLATPMSSDRRLDTATKIMSVVKSYNSVFARLLTSFPIGGDTLYAMLRCLAQLNSILRAKAINIDSRSLASQRLGAENFLGTTYLLSQVAKLTMHIAENPMPIRFLGVVPSRLNSSQVPSGLVVVSAISAKSWWDTQDTTSGPMFYELSGLVVLGMDILRYGFLLIRDSAAESSLDEFILSRALCRCTDAAMQIEKSIRSLHDRRPADTSGNSEHEQLRALGSKITAAVEELLLLIISRVRDIKKVQGSGGSNVNTFCKTIAFTLDYTQLESLNLGSSGADARDENYGSLVSELCQGLRNELDRTD